MSTKCRLLANLAAGLLIGLACASLAQAHEDMAVFHALRLDMDAGENRDNESVANWDLDGWVGGDDHKLWLKSEGEVTDHNTEHSETWALYSANVDTFWDVQAGIRYDNRPAATSYVVAGVTGLAPYHFETQIHLFASDDGDVSLRVREENDFLFTQKLILQPYLAINAAAQDVPALAIGAGLSDASIGLQLRYEITRQFAPYVALSTTRRYGGTAKLVEAAGGRRTDNTITAGVRLLF